MIAEQRMEVGLPKDPSGFVRRQCPHCQRTFKTMPSPFDARVLQRRLASIFPFENVDEGFEPVPSWHCLYCGHHADGDEWLARDHSDYLEALARGWANHVRYEQLSHVSRTLSQNPRPTFVAVAPDALPEGPSQDPEDLRVIPMVCCGEDVKAQWDWDGPFHCPRCGTRHGEPGGRHHIQLEFIQE
ncbi:hypothetical protein SAMN05444354_112118 [Stigmatella aurantiaca]|uniref:Uncharacterized protein n=1 Tax=Stigmatella aurantiaca TaxID=41 RepID=A0A1H7W2J9_STIAU|nr:MULTISPECIES: hypothetical protein [Stigmatella]SEM15544.1 hypothetical protein SAMN05444354_112118 [Stigmatella aurantiaca]